MKATEGKKESFATNNTKSLKMKIIVNDRILTRKMEILNGKIRIFYCKQQPPSNVFLTSSMAVRKSKKEIVKKGEREENFTAGQNEKCHQQVYKVFLQLLLHFTSSKLSLTLNFSLSPLFFFFFFILWKSLFNLFWRELFLLELSKRKIKF